MWQSFLLVYFFVVDVFDSSTRCYWIGAGELGISRSLCKDSALGPKLHDTNRTLIIDMDSRRRLTWRRLPCLGVFRVGRSIPVYALFRCNNRRFLEWIEFLPVQVGNQYTIPNLELSTSYNDMLLRRSWRGSWRRVPHLFTPRNVRHTVNECVLLKCFVM